MHYKTQGECLVCNLATLIAGFLSPGQAPCGVQKSVLVQRGGGDSKGGGAPSRGRVLRVQICQGEEMDLDGAHVLFSKLQSPTVVAVK